jgi:hypothetical protein
VGVAVAVDAVAAAAVAVAAVVAVTVSAGGVSDSFFTTVVYLRMSCDNVVAIYQIIHYHLRGEYISIYRK